jgi:hypothetical protein
MKYDNRTFYEPSLRYGLQLAKLCTGIKSWDTDFMARGQGCGGCRRNVGNVHENNIAPHRNIKHTVPRSTRRLALDTLYNAQKDQFWLNEANDDVDKDAGRGRRELLKNCARIYSLPES